MAGFTGWTKTSSVITKQAIDATSTTLENPLGTKVTAKHADYGDAEFIYLAAVASTDPPPFAEKILNSLMFPALLDSLFDMRVFNTELLE